jgi:cobalt-zinc-cadmium efflux system protein
MSDRGHDSTHDAAAHGHEHGHGADYKSLTARRLGWSLAITTVAMGVEFVGGWLTGSVALVSDAVHMLTHAFAIGIGLVGIVVARRPRCHHRTFGLLRAEVVAAFVNALFLLALTVWIVVEAVDRLIHPSEIVTLHMIIVAVFGLLVNLASVFLIEGSREGDMNVQAVFMHLVADAASSVAIVLAAVVIHFTEWTWLDPLVAMGIGALILVWAVGLTRDSLRVLLEMAPKGKNVEEIVSALRQAFPRIVDTDHEHVWTITPNVIVFSAHLSVSPDGIGPESANAWVQKVGRWLHAHYAVRESTLQVHWAETLLPDPDDPSDTQSDDAEPHGSGMEE